MEGNVFFSESGWSGKQGGFGFTGQPHFFPDAAASWDDKEWHFDTFKGDPY